MSLLECLLKMLQDGRLKEIESLESLEKIYEVSKEEGYKGTYKEFEKECSDIVLSASQKVSEESLKGVSGGKMNKNFSKSAAAVLSALTLSTTAMPSSSAASSKYSFQNDSKVAKVVNYLKNHPGETIVAAVGALGLGTVIIGGIAYFADSGEKGIFDDCKNLNNVGSILETKESVGNNIKECINNLDSLIRYFHNHKTDSVSAMQYLVPYMVRVKEAFPNELDKGFIELLKQKMSKAGLTDKYAEEFIEFVDSLRSGTVNNAKGNVCTHFYINHKLGKNSIVPQGANFKLKIVSKNNRLDSYFEAINKLKKSGIKFSVGSDKNKYPVENLSIRAGEQYIFVLTNKTALNSGNYVLHFDKNAGWETLTGVNEEVYLNKEQNISIAKDKNGNYSVYIDGNTPEIKKQTTPEIKKQTTPETKKQTTPETGNAKNLNNLNGDNKKTTSSKRVKLSIDERIPANNYWSFKGIYKGISDWLYSNAYKNWLKTNFGEENVSIEENDVQIEESLLNNDVLHSKGFEKHELISQNKEKEDYYSRDGYTIIVKTLNNSTKNYSILAEDKVKDVLNSVLEVLSKSISKNDSNEVKRRYDNTVKLYRSLGGKDDDYNELPGENKKTTSSKRVKLSIDERIPANNYWSFKGIYKGISDWLYSDAHKDWLKANFGEENVSIEGNDIQIEEAALNKVLNSKGFEKHELISQNKEKEDYYSRDGYTIIVKTLNNSTKSYSILAEDKVKDVLNSVLEELSKSISKNDSNEVKRRYDNTVELYNSLGGVSDKYKKLTDEKKK